ncbi:MAG: O-antigen ligase family protein [Bacteroidetes bacterium]|nr:O-antigen ligase family protein [Bacteroidota bacterium]MBS1944948.1 O-antigen ligase family protein [Bacteroidota bacterium]
MLSKRKVINSLFMLSIPWYGFGGYSIMKQGFGAGVFICAMPFLAILAFYAVDMLYGQAPRPRVNGKFLIVMGALLSLSASVLLGLHYKSPLITQSNGIMLIVLFNVPFLSSVLVQTYNRDDPEFDMAWLVMKGFILYVAFNLAGMAAGMRNLMHHFPGRANPPFALGLYDATHMLAVINLMLLSYLGEFKANPLRWFGLATLYMVDMAMILSINSRLSVMIFIVLTALFATKAMKKLKGLYTVSLFTMPIMMTFALLIYQILSLPVFVAIMERVDKKDITTFNGRTYIWESAGDWLMNDRRGLLFGNGYNGQYHLRLLDWVAKLWGEKGSYRLHMHSAFLEFLVDQGIVGILLLYGVYWSGYKFYQGQYKAGTRMAPLYAGFVYLMFAWQIDIVGYGIYSGFVLLMLLMGPVVMRQGGEAVTAIEPLAPRT